MADDTSKQGPADRIRVNVHEPYELRYWTTKFHCSEEQLVDAVEHVGVMAKDVERYLDKRGH
jgi:hypothetical protein